MALSIIDGTVPLSDRLERKISVCVRGRRVLQALDRSGKVWETEN